MNADPKTAQAGADRTPATLVQEESPSAAANPNASPNMMRIWLRRSRALLLVTLCATFGVLLVILPWTPQWTDNPLLLGSPELRQLVSHGFVRGLTSGLGLLDLWLGFWEAIHYHESC